MALNSGREWIYYAGIQHYACIEHDDMFNMIISTPVIIVTSK